KSETQTATVVENSDPDGLGRIRVQFAWQKPLGERTPWLRMMTPHAGADKGFHFIPEINEEVMVGFEGGNAERPFVLGALYNGSQNPSAWQSQNNNIKAIRTRSDHTIKLDDTSGAEMITITDKNNNIIQIDTAGKSIMISAPENVSIVAKNIELNASESISIGASDSVNVNAGEDVSVTAKNIHNLADEEMSLQSEDIEANAKKIRVDSTEENLELASAKQVDVQSNDKVKLF
uniref:phage baseplate assembly protein V n=1 Tax=Aquimarina sp. I32.4 TaxID=2053903 RepID=UPI0011AEEAC5